MKRRSLSIISLLLALLTAVSCTGAPPAETAAGNTESLIVTAPETEPAAVLPEGIILAGGEFGTKLSLRCPDGFGGLLRSAQSFADYVNKYVPGAEVTASYDTTPSDTEYTLIIAPPELSVDGEYSIALEGKEIKLRGKNTAAIEEALAYLKATAVKDGYLFIPEALSFSTGAGPALISQSPEKLYYYEDIYTPELNFTYDSSKLAKDGARLFVGGAELTDKAAWSEGSVTLSGITFEAGDYPVLLMLTDTDGNTETVESAFSCGDGSVMNLYSGEVHAHTSDSDGESTVDAAYKYARDTAKLDFFAITDHSDSFKNEVYQNKHLPNADKYNEPGVFAALYGYEQTYNHSTGFFGHLNTLNYGSLTSKKTGLEKYYDIMAADPNSVVMFNHPGYKWGNFLEYGLYSEKYDAVIDLAEIKGKGYDTEYALALTKGWHISPVYNEDNHDPNWGAAGEYCGYALAPSLTRQNIIEAFKKNRTYTTIDKTLKVYYKINGEWMGSRLAAPDKLNVSIDLSTEKDNGLGIAYLVAEDNIVVATKVFGTRKEASWDFELDALYDYYYLKVVSADGKNWCVTAPIWIEEREELTMSELSQSIVTENNSKADHRISLELTNNSSSPMTDAVVNFYASTRSGFDGERAKPIASVKLAQIDAGQTLSVYADIEYLPTAPAIYAAATAKQGDKSFGAVRYLEISNIYFSEIVPLTTKGGTDLYEFIELYNNSDTEINLSGYTLQYYPKAGAKAEDLEKNVWKLSGRIAPRSTLVLWFTSASSKLTVADFNKTYSTSLIEGKDIVRIVGNQIPHTNAIQLEIKYGSTVVARCWYNWGNARNTAHNTAIIYDYPTDYTFTAKPADSRLTPTPGKLADGQMPEAVKK